MFFEEIPEQPEGRNRDFCSPGARWRRAARLRPYEPDIRAHDSQCLTDLAISDLLDLHNIKRLSFRDLRELQRVG
jgi:hypothetical protein